jgi:hypothetical protein
MSSQLYSFTWCSGCQLTGINVLYVLRSSVELESGDGVRCTNPSLLCIARCIYHYGRLGFRAD